MPFLSIRILYFVGLFLIKHQIYLIIQNMVGLQLDSIVRLNLLLLYRINKLSKIHSFNTVSGFGQAGLSLVISK